MSSTRICLFVIAFTCLVGNGSADQYKIVDSDNGQIRGIKSTTLLKGDSYYAFKGIPYAKPPIGELRFKVTNPINWILFLTKETKYNYFLSIWKLCDRHQSRANHGNRPFWTHSSTAIFVFNQDLHCHIHHRKMKTVWHWIFLFPVKTSWNSIEISKNNDTLFI